MNQGPDDQSYFDGGVYDNAPVSVLRDRGYNRLIIIDISAMKGMAHKQDLSCSDIIYIRPFDPKDLGESFEFEKGKTRYRMEMGYLDTKKAFGKFYGRCFYFNARDYKKLQLDYGFRAVNDMELLADALEIEKYVLYTPKQFVDILKQAFVDARFEALSSRQVLGRTIYTGSEKRKDALKSIANRDKKNVRFKTAIDLLEEMTDGMEPSAEVIRAYEERLKEKTEKNENKNTEN